MKPFAIPVFFLTMVAFPAPLGAAAPLSPDQAKILESVRASALRYTQRLPDFMCTQITHRQVSSLGNSTNHMTGVAGPGTMGGLPAMMASAPNLGDVIEERLTFIDHKENYTVLTVNGRKAAGMDHMQFQGAISAGEFGSDLHNVFDPRSGTVFALDHPGSLHGRRVYIYSFRVPSQEGAAVIDRDSGRQVVVAYAGRVLIDVATLEVLRIEYHLDLAGDFPIRDAAITIEYRPVTIADRRSVLPFRSEVRMQDASHQYVNVIDFRNYHKFAVESTVLYGAESPQ